MRTAAAAASSGRSPPRRRTSRRRCSRATRRAGAPGNASSDLAFAVSLVGADRELALRGGGRIPAVALSSIHNLRDRDLAERNGVIKLRDDRARAVDAYDLVEWCHSHLWAACLLLDYPGISGVDGFVDAERLAAALENAMELAEESAALAGGARDDVSGAN